MSGLAERVVRCCRELAACTEEPGRTTRPFLSAHMRDVHRILSGWMCKLGMQVRVDPAGNLRGLYGDPRAPRLLIGSHLDTVPDAGAFDGILGVVVGIAMAELKPRVALEVIGFSEEEGVRFGLPFIGSRAVVGKLDSKTLLRQDRRGISIAEAIRDFGLDPKGISQAKLAKESIAYLEFHIEQGPVLDSLGLPLGVVETIVGQSRLLLTLKGMANHAGTTPMHLRRDALAAAAQVVTLVESHASHAPELVATVGWLTVSPNASNVIPGEVHLSLDVRHPSDQLRREYVDALLDESLHLCERRGVDFRSEVKMDQPAVAMHSGLSAMLADAAPGSHRMNSGAGHDAMIIAPHLPSAMLFVRSPGGISHHPDENVSVEDVDAAIAAGNHFMQKLEMVDV